MLPDVINTPRLVLRPYRQSDVEEIFKYASDPEWARYLPGVPQPYLLEHAQQFVNHVLSWDRSTHPSWCIEYEGQCVGGINIRFFSDNHLAEVGYSVAKWLWGQGIVHEAAYAVFDVAFKTFAELNRIRATADRRNDASLNLMYKLGMRREGILRANRYEREEYIDEVVCGILRDEWFC